jgi:protein-disulfide isomerase
MRPQSGYRLTVPVSRRDHLAGPINAAATLLEYGDYECLACGTAHPLIQAIRESFGDRLCFAFRHFPLTNIHPHSESAAEAVEAAGVQGGFWEMHDTLFENQMALEYDDIAEYASSLGLDTPRLINEVVTGVHHARVRADFASGIRSGVNGTPTFFINAVRYDGPRDFDSMVRALAYTQEW